MKLIDAIADPQAAIRNACQVLAMGEPVAIPTETVYGLAGDIHNARSIRRIYEIKGRPAHNPLICHVSSLSMAEEYVSFNESARTLAEAFWPGPLTLVLSRRVTSAALELASANLPTLAIRVPEGISRDLIERFGRGLAAPSANRSGCLSPTSAGHVHAGLGDKVPLIMDGGPCNIGLESTVVDVTEAHCRLLRPGGLDAAAIERVLGEKLWGPVQDCALPSPGMMSSHYAPRAAVRLNCTHVFPGEAVVTLGPHPVSGAETAASVVNLSESGDLNEAAFRLFDALKRADDSGAKTIAVVAIPAVGIGNAINDRLQRSAAPRPTQISSVTGDQ